MRINASRQRGHRSCRLFEKLEDRCLLAVGPFLHTHTYNNGVDTLLVVNADDGQIQVSQRLSGFATTNGSTDDRVADIAFSPEGKLFGITDDWLYEIDTTNGTLTSLGQHGIPKANSMVFTSAGKLNVMARESAELYEITINETDVTSSVRAVLSGVDGIAGDIAYAGNDLVVAATDGTLKWFRFDVAQDRPRLVNTFDLTTLGFFTEGTGIAVVDNERLYVTGEDKIVEFALPSNQPTNHVVTVNTTVLRGAAFYREAGGPVPAGTLSGVKWNDANADGKRQSNEKVLVDWDVYIDLDLDGQFDDGEPTQSTDEDGRFYFFGKESGLYTIDEIIPSGTDWRQTAPVSPHRNLVGVYDFDGRSLNNSLFHNFGLPALVAGDAVTLADSSVQLLSGNSYLELPVALAQTDATGQGDFSIVVQASYDDAISGGRYLVSQGSSTSDDELDFKIIVSPESDEVTTSFCSTTCQGPTLGDFDFDDARYGITWDGSTVGNYVVGNYTTRSVTGTLPDIDGAGVRFGNPVSNGLGQAASGTIREIRIYNAALSESELDAAFAASTSPSAYSVYLNETDGIGGLDFGNTVADPPDTVVEIDVRRDSVDGASVASGAELVFETIVTGEDLPRIDLWIRSDGDAVLDVTSIVATEGIRVEGFTAGSIAVGASAQLTLVRTGTAVFPGELQIRSNDPDESLYSITLNGTNPPVEIENAEIEVFFGTNGPPIQSGGVVLVPPDVTSGSILAIKNIGNEDLVISSYEIDGDFSLRGTPVTLVKDGSTTITVSLTTSEAGLHNGRLRIFNNDSNENPYIVNLISNLIVDVPDIELRIEARNGRRISNAGTLNLGTGTADSPPSRTLWILNTGDEALEVSEITKTGDFEIVGDTAFTLQSGQSTSIDILVTDLSLGEKEGELSIFSNDPDEDPFVISLGAEIAEEPFGIEVRLGDISGDEIVSGETLDFGSAFPGFLPLRNDLAIRNTGTESLTIDELTTTGGFEIADFSATTLEPNESITITIVGPIDGRGQRVGQFTLASHELNDSFTLSLVAAVDSANNGLDPMDVNNDGSVTPIDVLLIINEVNVPTFTDVNGQIEFRPEAPTLFPDVNDDGFVVAFDALLIINQLNRISRGTAAAVPQLIGSTSMIRTELSDIALCCTEFLDPLDEEQASRKSRAAD